VALSVTSGRKRRRPHAASSTTALIPAAARQPEFLTPAEATLNDDAVETFARVIGGREELAQVLSVATTAPDVDQVVTHLLDPRYAHWSLRTLCHRAGLTVADLLAAYKKAVITRAHVEASAIIARKLPPIVEDVMTRATPLPIVCPACKGDEAKRHACFTCHGTGAVRSEPDLDRQKLALELGQMVAKGGGLLIQQNQVVAATQVAAHGPGVLEQLQQAVGEVLFRPRRPMMTQPDETEPEPELPDLAPEPDDVDTPEDEDEDEPDKPAADAGGS
jgi:hypothetical protein